MSAWHDQVMGWTTVATAYAYVLFCTHCTHTTAVRLDVAWHILRIEMLGCTAVDVRQSLQNRRNLELRYKAKLNTNSGTYNQMVQLQKNMNQNTPSMVRLPDQIYHHAVR